jgi:hypothetical protein
MENIYPNKTAYLKKITKREFGPKRNMPILSKRTFSSDGFRSCSVWTSALPSKNRFNFQRNAVRINCVWRGTQFLCVGFILHVTEMNFRLKWFNLAHDMYETRIIDFIVGYRQILKLFFHNLEWDALAHGQTGAWNCSVFRVHQLQQTANIVTQTDESFDAAYLVRACETQHSGSC